MSRTPEITAKPYPPPTPFSMRDVGGHARWKKDGEVYRILGFETSARGSRLFIRQPDGVHLEPASDFQRVKQVTEWMDDP